jgi:hypothetical protein
VGTYTFMVTDTLRLTVVKQCPDTIDGPYSTAFFASFPLTRSS